MIKIIKKIVELVDLIERKVFDVLPLVDKKCCDICGGCGTMCMGILEGVRKRADCVLRDSRIKLTVNGKEITMVSFVQKILFNEVIGIVKELHGYEKGASIKLEINE